MFTTLLSTACILLFDILGVFAGPVSALISHSVTDATVNRLLNSNFEIWRNDFEKHDFLVRAGQNITKPLCPVFNSSAVPAIRPVALPDITALTNGQILVGQQQLPTQIKVRPHLKFEISKQTPTYIC